MGILQLSVVLERTLSYSRFGRESCFRGCENTCTVAVENGRPEHRCMPDEVSQGSLHRDMRVWHRQSCGIST